MQTVTLVSAVVLVAVVLLTAPPTANAACCRFHREHFYSDGVCGDCTKPTPFCGYGKCNIFGCNCDGGCRRGSCYPGRRERSDDESPDAEELVSAGDLNGDGLLSVEEAETLLPHEPTEEHRRSVRSLDKDMDGMLTAEEIDE